MLPLADLSAETVGQLGIGGLALGFLLWLIRHTVTVTFPQVMGDILKLIAQERQDHRADLKTERDQCAANHREAMTFLGQFRGENAELHQDTRHGMKDVAHAIGLKKVAEEMARRDPGPRAGG